MGLGKGAGSAPQALQILQLGARGLSGLTCALWLSSSWRGHRDRSGGAKDALLHCRRPRQGLLETCFAFPQVPLRSSEAPPPQPRARVLGFSNTSPAPGRLLRFGEELRRAGTIARGGAEWEHQRELVAALIKKRKDRMAGEHSTVTSLFAQSTDLTAPHREDIR
ncbi:hypothetical protein GW7_13114 [Heterocephalus glaber]|uniref:Uncharacterized protein n=1 Tax=Heterocephalus glaber TaxID=10181 RepID=G5B4I4_HETGA|nr:hypothetical protein GW7_13114 [Heterocephalus glaber]